jgi:hypothetical protein
MIHGVLCWASGCESMRVMLSHWLWIMVSYGEPGVVKHGLLWFGQWVWIMVCYAEPVLVNHDELRWGSGCEIWCVILSMWLWIMVCYSEPMVVNHGELCWASGCESWWVMLITHHHSQQLAQHNPPWFTTTCSAKHTMIHNLWLSITHQDSHPLAQHSSPWFTTIGSE